MRKVGCVDGDCLSSLRVTEAQLEERIRLRSSGRAAQKEVLFLGNERAFNVARLGGDKLPEFCSVEHREGGSFA